MKNELISSAVVRILNSDGIVMGGGVLAERRTLITCAHVVVDALDLGSSPETSPTQKVNFDFPLQPSHEEELFAFVSAWYKEIEGGERFTQLEDIAILKIPESVTLPQSAVPAERKVLPRELLTDRDIKILGFPDRFDSGDWIDGTLTGPIGLTRMQFNTDLGRRSLARGYSGSPVWESKTNKVLGIVVADAKRDDDRFGYMIPMTAIVRHCSDFGIDIIDQQAVQTSHIIQLVGPHSPVTQISPLCFQKAGRIARSTTQSLTIQNCFDDWMTRRSHSPLIFIFDSPQDIPNELGNISYTGNIRWLDGWNYIAEMQNSAFEAELSMCFEEDNSTVLFIEYSRVILDSLEKHKTSAPSPQHSFFDSLHSMLNAAAKQTIPVVAALPRFLLRRPYAGIFPRKSLIYENGPLFSSKYVVRLDWILSHSFIERIGYPLSHLLAINSNAVIFEVVHFLNEHGVEGSIEVTRSNPENLDLLFTLAGLLYQNYFFEIAFRLESYCRYFLSEPGKFPSSANVYTKTDQLDEITPIGLLRDSTTISSAYSKAVLISSPGGGKSKLLSQIEVASCVPDLVADTLFRPIAINLDSHHLRDINLQEFLQQKLRGTDSAQGFRIKPYDNTVFFEISNLLDKIRLGDLFSSPICVLLDTNQIILSETINDLETHLYNEIGAPEVTGYILAGNNEAPPNQRSVPWIELRSLTNDQVSAALKSNRNRLEDFYDLELYMPFLRPVLRSPFMINVFTKLPAGEQIALGKSIELEINRGLQGFPNQDKVLRQLMNITCGLDAVPETDTTNKTESGIDLSKMDLLTHIPGSSKFRLAYTLMHDFFLAKHLAEICLTKDHRKAVEKLQKFEDQLDKQSRVALLCIELLARTSRDHFIDELSEISAVIAHRAALYDSWLSRSFTTALLKTRETLLTQLHEKKISSKYFVDLGPADPRIDTSNPVSSCSILENIGDRSEQLISRYPVTIMEYLRFVWDAGYSYKEFWSKQGWDWKTMHISVQHNAPWLDPELACANYPVLGVSYFEAEAYCAWLNQQFDDCEFWLPTATLWDRIAFGNHLSVWGKLRNSEQFLNEGVEGRPIEDFYTDERLAQWIVPAMEETESIAEFLMQDYPPSNQKMCIRPVGSTPPNKADLYDMFGLCWQWCATDVNGFNLQPHWQSDSQHILNESLIVKGGSFPHKTSAIWTIVGGWMKPDTQYRGTGFRTVCLRNK